MDSKNWIDVRDIMPNAGEWVLCFNEDLQLTDGFVIQSWTEGTNKDYDWFQKSFTHWAPLQPPKKSD